MMPRRLKLGFDFRAGRLEITTPDEVMRVHAWPDLKAERRRASGRFWKTFTPQFRLLRRMNAADSSVILGPEDVPGSGIDPIFEKLRAFTLLRHSLPPEISRAVEGFTNRQWVLLRFCRRKDRGHEFLEQSPALGYAIVHHEYFRTGISSGLETAVRAAAFSQRKLVRWLGFPDSNTWVKILSKVTMDAIEPRSLVALQQISRIQELEKPLRHLKRINSGIIALISDPHVMALVAPGLLSGIAESDDPQIAREMVHLLRDLVDLRRRRELPDQIVPFRSIEQIRRRQQETVEEHLQQQKLKREREEVLPEPPVPGNEVIVPLSRASQLREEGELQHNCVGGYAHRVQKGNIYIYRVLSPQRATLSIQRGEDSCWHIQQLSIACNQRASEETRLAVQRWVDQYSISLT